MKLVTYNIQYGKGADGEINLGRIASTVAGADVIGLNEVERFWPRNGQAVDQPAEISALLPEYYWNYGPYFDVDASGRSDDGTIRNRRRQHGSMILSRKPIIASRLHILPKRSSDSQFSMQMGGLEAIIEGDTRAVRVYAVHLSSLAGHERMLQVQALLDIHNRVAIEGGVWSGAGEAEWSCGETPPPDPTDAIMMGDFNCEPDTPEYQVLTGSAFLDSWSEVGKGPKGETLLTSRQPSITHDMRIDYIFVSAGMRHRLETAYVDGDADGSDHQPLWLEIKS